MPLGFPQMTFSEMWALKLKVFNIHRTKLSLVSRNKNKNQANLHGQWPRYYIKYLKNVKTYFF